MTIHPEVLSEIPISTIRVRAAATGTAKPISRKRFEKWLAEHDREVANRDYRDGFRYGWFSVNGGKKWVTGN